MPRKKSTAIPALETSTLPTALPEDYDEVISGSVELAKRTFIYGFAQIPDVVDIIKRVSRGTPPALRNIRPLCTKAMYTCWEIMTGSHVESGRGGFSNLIEQYPELVEHGLIFFLFYNSVPLQLQTLHLRLDKCSCDMSDPLIAFYHEPKFIQRLPNDMPLFHSLGKIVAQEFADYLFPAAGDRSLVKKLLRPKSPHPSHTWFLVLYPFTVREPKYAIRSSTVWFEMTHSPVFIRLLCELSAIALSSARLYLAVSDDFPAVPHNAKLGCCPTPSYLLDCLNLIMSDMQQYSSRSPDLVIKSAVYYTKFLLFMISRPGCARAACSKDDLTRYWTTLCSVLKLLQDDRFIVQDLFERSRHHSKAHLVSAAKIIWKELQARGEELPKAPEVFDPVEDPAQKGRPCSTLLVRLFKMEQTVKRCMNVDCGKCWCASNYLNPFRQCARCRTAHYCSSECQRSAWSSSTHPHREICKDLGALTLSSWGVRHARVWRDVFGDSLDTPLPDEPELATEERVLEEKARASGVDAEGIDRLSVRVLELTEVLTERVCCEKDTTRRVVRAWREREGKGA